MATEGTGSPKKTITERDLLTMVCDESAGPSEIDEVVKQNGELHMEAGDAPGHENETAGRRVFRASRERRNVAV